jgi:hypothetical protein
MNLVERILAIADALDDGSVPWAFGGAFALAFATAEPRGTRDIDVNVFVDSSRAERVFAALPVGVEIPASARRSAQKDDQVRLMWDDTPIDLFFSISDFHREVHRRCLTVPFAGRMVRVLCAEDLAIFKAVFDRPKDWVDIDSMDAANALDRSVASARLAGILDAADPRIARLAHRKR